MTNRITIFTAIAITALACASKPAEKSTPQAAQSELAPAAEVEPAIDSLAEQPKVPVDDIEIESEHDPGMDFTKLKTYAWTDVLGEVNDPFDRWSPPDINIADKIKDIINREMNARGLTEVEQNPDVLVSFSILLDLEAVSVLVIAENNEAIIENIPSGSLLIAVLNPDDDTPLWVGAATAEVEVKPKHHHAIERLDYAITNILATLPQ